MPSEKMTIDEWAKEIGGRFAHILELTKEGDALFALIRTNDSWDGRRYKVPDDVEFELSRIKGWVPAASVKDLPVELKDEELPF